jgi:hypothetical protein
VEGKLVEREEKRQIRAIKGRKKIKVDSESLFNS